MVVAIPQQELLRRSLSKENKDEMSASEYLDSPDLHLKAIKDIGCKTLIKFTAERLLHGEKGRYMCDGCKKVIDHNIVREEEDGTTTSPPEYARRYRSTEMLDYDICETCFQHHYLEAEKALEAFSHDDV